MAGLAARAWKDSYKNVIIIGDTTWTGVTGTLQQLKDGNGVALPLLISSNALRIPDGLKLYFHDQYKYFYNPDANTIEVVSPIFKVPKVYVNHVSAVSILVTSGTIGICKGTTGRFTKNITASTVSAAGFKTTGKIIAGTLSGTTIKGTFEGAIGTKGGGIAFTTGGGEKMAASPKSLFFYTASNKLITLNETKLFPVIADMSLGSTASKWKNIYTGSAFFTNMTATRIVTTGGMAKGLSSMSAISARGYKVRATSQLLLTDGASMFLDTAKTARVKYDSNAIKIVGGNNGLHIQTDGKIVPVKTASAELGTAAAPFVKTYTTRLISPAASVTKVITPAVSTGGTFYLNAASIEVVGIAVGSAGCKFGQLYRASGAGAVMVCLTP